MDDAIDIVPFMGQLTAESIRLMLQQQFQQDYFKIAHSLAPEPFMRHAALSSAIQTIRQQEQRNGL